MNKYSISFEGNLTSYNFYNSILKQLHEYYQNDGITPLLFDFTRVNVIDTLVIPNLLCVGYIVKNNSGFIPQLRISDNINAAGLRRYLNDIKFVHLSETYGLFEINESVKGGFSDKGIAKNSTTVLFNQDENESVSWNKLVNTTYKFTEKYLRDFSYEGNKDETNTIVSLCSQIIDNAKRHGNSFAFMSLQYNYALKKACIAISDCGIGYTNSYNEQIGAGNPTNLLINEKANDDIEGIIQALFARSKSKIYGLYNVIKQIIEKDGIVRIHSMTTQLVLTSRLRLHLEVGDNEESLKSLVKHGDFTPNIKSNMKFGGVHIEMEIPLNIASESERMKKYVYDNR